MSKGEFEFIASCLAPLARGFDGALDLGDDAALIDTGGGQSLVIAKDALVEGVHFHFGDPPDLVARKLLRTNLSDMAAMGAVARYYLTSIARPAEQGFEWLEAIARGFATDQEIWPITLIGGDTVGTSGPAVLSCTMIGEVETGRALLRSGARAGDAIFVTGTLGDAAMGLRVLEGLAAGEEARSFLSDRYHLPQPRTRFGAALCGLATAAIDISDGLVADLGHILERSGVGAVVETARVPLSTHASGLPGALEAALYGGDDYELLFTMPCDCLADLPVFEDVPVTRIGGIRAEPGLRLLDSSGRPMPVGRSGWRHF
ncbi:MAG: thiamine-phosphate kinase [Geminicoccaceae bacterium]|nr:thiamine-phosphate kinase [Geminicoccaceae bacterium]